MVEVSESFFPYMNQRLANEEVDICLASMVDLDFNYNLIVLSNEEIWMIVPAGHPYCTGTDAALKTLAPNELTAFFHEDLFLFTSKGSTSRRLVEEFFNKLHFYPKIYGYFDNVNTLRSLVADGIGISFLPSTSLMPPLDDIRCFTFAPPLLRKHVLAYRKSLQITPAVEDFFELIRRYDVPASLTATTDPGKEAQT